MITLTDIAGLFERGVLTDPVDGDDLIILARLAKTGTDKKSGKFNIAVAKASTIGSKCPVDILDAPFLLDDKEHPTPDPDNLLIDGVNCNQYYRIKIDGEGESGTANPVVNVGGNTFGGKVITPLPAGTYIIYIEYSFVGASINRFWGVEWPLGVTPAWTNTNGKRDIVTIVSDGVVNRGVATLGYDA